MPPPVNPTTVSDFSYFDFLQGSATLPLTDLYFFLIGDANILDPLFRDDLFVTDGLSIVPFPFSFNH